MSCHCPVHINTLRHPPTPAQKKGIMIDGVRHWRRDCGCNVVGEDLPRNTIGFCPKDDFSGVNLKDLCKKP